MELSKVLQVVGLVLVTPTVVNILYRFIIMLSVRFVKYIKVSKINGAPTGIFIARRYLHGLNIVRKRKGKRETLVNIFYTLSVSLITSLLLLSLISWIPINHPLISWIPIWLKIVASIYAFIMIILEPLFFAIWDYILVRFPPIKNWALSLPTQIAERNLKNILSRYLRIMLVNPPKRRPLVKLLVNMAIIIFSPLAGFIIVAQYILLLTLHYIIRSDRAREAMVVIGAILIAIGIIIG